MEIPIIFEKKKTQEYDYIILMNVNKKIQRQRVMKRKNVTADWWTGGIAQTRAVKKGSSELQRHARNDCASVTFVFYTKTSSCSRNTKMVIIQKRVLRVHILLAAAVDVNIHSQRNKLPNVLATEWAHTGIARSKAVKSNWRRLETKVTECVPDKGEWMRKDAFLHSSWIVKIAFLV